ncbi:pilus assembly protein TadC [Sphingosinicella humi]|uniref:Pilus assembly protein TadC n=2 Tax=Allosphingosinicella humi TaxID=2068657 RepID=A0A2U2J5Y2_9SPHN|nr:pilus assembly protein TadC [Sphingosinicella humi]
MMTHPLLQFDSTSVAAFAAAVMFVSLLFVMRALTPVDNVSARARSHSRRRGELRAAWLSSPRSRRRERPMSIARRLVEMLKLNGGKDAKDAASLLARAGWRSPDAIILFLTVRLASPLLLALAGYYVAPAGDGQMMRLFTGAAGAMAGTYLPKILIRNAIQRRQQKVLKGLPEALDLLVICAEAGLSLDAAVKRVGSEMGANAPELADELGLTAVELAFLPDRREALSNLAARVGIAEVDSLVNTLTQTEKYGTPLAQALRVLSQDFRASRMMRAEQKAARLPAVMTVPMMVFILPPLFVVLVGPAIVEVLSTTIG